MHGPVCDGIMGFGLVPEGSPKGCEKPIAAMRVIQDMGSTEDIQAMLAFQRGDEKGFEVLYERYSQPILNYLYRFTWDRSVAEELTQEVFLRVCRAARTYEPRTAFRSWLYQIATNVGRNEVRKPAYSVRQDSLDSNSRMRTEGPGPTQPDPASECPEEMAIARRLEQFRSLDEEQRKRIIENYRAFQRLPNAEKKVILKNLARWQAMSPDEKEKVREQYRQFLDRFSPEQQEKLRELRRNWNSLSPETRKQILRKIRDRENP